MQCRELMQWLARFPADYDVKLQTMPELEYSPYLIIYDNPARAEILIHAVHDPLANTSSYADITKKGEKSHD